MWKRSFFSAALLAAFISNTAAVLAGTTGNVTGAVVSTTGKPIAGAHVIAVSPSQTSTTTTDAAGHFTLLSLAPDTYTISASKDGFDTVSEAGISIFADQVQNVRIALQPSLKTIARVTTRSSMDLVKSGTTADVYSVNSAVSQAAAGVGGGGNLNNAYSAIATVPGTFVPPNQQGWDQVVYIRGGNFDQVGYEYDGVPVNRSFDNYPGSTAGTLGQQELQVYAGGGTVGQSTSGLAGFINQVIKTGTYPGFADVNAGLGTPTYYHNLQVEVGGATPDRQFSYYAGIGGYNQDFRYLDQFNGQNLGLVWGYPTIAFNTTHTYFGGDYPICQFTPPSGGSYYGSPYYSGPNASPVYDPFTLSPGQPGYIAPPVNTEQPQKYYGGVNDPGCYNTVSPAYFNYSNLVDRESVINLHFGVPHKHDAGRDDIQVLYNPVALQTQYYSSGNDIGPHLVSQLDQLAGYGNVPLIWGDFVTWPAGTHPGQSAGSVSAVPYMMPSSPSGRCANVYPSSIPGVPLPQGSCGTGSYANVPYSAVPLDSRDSFWNNSSIVKLQYQHNMGSNAYVRVYGYTFYSDWLQTSPLSYGSFLFGLGATSYDYELEAHTRGIALTFADQLNSQHLLTFDTNYTTATTNRFNNTTFNNYLDTNASNLTNGSQCFAMFTGPVYPGTPVNKVYNPVIQAGQPAPCNSRLSSGTFGDPQDSYLCAAGSYSSSSISCLTALPKGASWQVTSSGTSGFHNQVTPEFTTLSLQDQWNPTEQLNVQVGLRDENYQYNLANTTSNGQNFWFLADQHEFCYDPKTLAPLFIPEPPASFRPANPFIGLTCPAGYVHPDGKNGHLLLSNNYGSTINDNAFTPRLGATYTLNPDTVIRVSAGRFAQPPQTYQVQYNAADSNLPFDLFQAFWQYGYTTPRHDPNVQYSNNYDASLEKRFKGTDMSIKLTPYLRYATNQVYGISLPYGLSGGFNSGTERVDGVEFEFTKGDFSKDGLSLIFSYTYTNAAEKWNNFPNSSINPIDQYNQDIQNFNVLTKAGGGAACYYNSAPSYGNGYQGSGNVVPDPNCAAIPAGKACNPSKYTSADCYNPVVRNPYYNLASQPLLDRNGWYPVGLDFPYLSPNVASLLVNYKRGRFAITPALTFNEGQPYGYPADVYGNDPRTCTRNSAGLINSTIHKTDPLQADWTSCVLAATQGGTSPGSLFIPNPQTGHFDTFGEFRQPSQLNLSLSIAYDISPRIKVTAMLANLVNACFGGSSEPWTKQFPPNAYTCGYIPSYYYISNFYNGTSPNDKGANGVTMNPAFASSYIPAYADTNSFVLPNPFNAYFSVNVKI